MQRYDYPPDSINQFPAVIPLVENFDPSMVIASNSIEGTLRIICVVERAEVREAWLRLYELMDSTGSGTSVIAALKADPTLTTSVDSSFVARVENIGGKQINNQQYIGFDVLVPFVRFIA
jgi:hypothetical protein